MYYYTTLYHAIIEASGLCPDTPCTTPYYAFIYTHLHLKLKANVAYLSHTAHMTHAYP